MCHPADLMPMDSNQKPNHSGKIVIAGGTGLIGLHTARLLLAEGRNVVLLSRHAPGKGFRHTSTRMVASATTGLNISMGPQQ